MRIPPIPSNEAARLRALDETGLLDTVEDERFDRITRIAQRLFDVPIAIFSLVDAKRQWFKSIQGLQVKETPREVSFCGHAILHEGVFCVEDASGDERFADNPLVVDGPRIRFYAGTAIHSLGGLPIGTLCIIDQRPRSFDAADRRTLLDLAAILEGEVQQLNKHVSVLDAASGC
jgi:GAF domain-containing protein